MEIQEFIQSWEKDPNGARDIFISLKELLEELGDTTIAFKARPGVSYSMRGVKGSQKRPLFVMVDVIDDDPDERWLSVCFYGDSVTDPDEVGDLVPGGLLGEDGFCFDVETEHKEYIRERVKEAHSKAV